MNNNTLNTGSSLQGGKYVILSILGQGGFGITYEAEQVLLKKRVAIKEFFMKDCCDRDVATSQVTVGTGSQRELVAKFKKKFLREAQTIAGFRHANIVNVTDVFEENGTAYYVMDYLPGGSLSSLIKKYGPLDPQQAEHYIRQVSDALSYIHSKNTLHLDIKPANILLDSGGNAVLIDFGISKHYDEAGQQTSSTPVGISKGFAPLEQSLAGSVSQFKPSTDIYSLGATLYNILTGILPPEASIVNEDGLERKGTIADKYWNVIEKSMQPKRKDRPQSVEEFLSLLNTYKPQSSTSTLEDSEETTLKTEISHSSNSQNISAVKASKSHTKKWMIWLLCSFLSFILAGLIIDFVLRNQSLRELESPLVFAGDEESYYDNGHEWVDLGLSVKWATCNVGASSPGDYGNFFAWGETSSKSDYSWSNYLWCNGSFDNLTRYNTDSSYGTVDNVKILYSSDDAARANWGGSWHVPTKSEFEELLKNCTRSWTTQGGHSGYRFTSKKNGNSIFLPAAGNRHGTEFSNVGSGGSYWSSSLDTDYPTIAWSLHFNSTNGSMNSSYRIYGFSVRPVTE